MKQKLQWIFLILFSPIVSVAQITPEYTTPWGTSNNVFPWRSTTNLVQWIYHPADFTPTITAGNITKIYYAVHDPWLNSGPQSTFTNITIKMGTTTQANTVNGPWIAGLTTVFQKPTFTVLTPMLSWAEFELDVPFYWDGVSNLVIEGSQQGFTPGFYIVNETSGGNRRAWGTVGSAASTGAGTGLACIGIDMGSENDAGVESLVAPAGGDICSGVHQVIVNCRNFGSNDLTSFDVNWTLNGVPQTPVSVSNVVLNPFMTTGDNMNVTLGNAYLPFGVPVQLKAWTSDPNTVLDEYNDNDTLNVTLASTFEGITLNELNDTTICKGDSLTLDAGFNPNTDYTWSNGTQAQVNIITQPGTYWVWAYNPSGCQAFDTFNVTLVPEPTAGPYVVGIDNGAGEFTFNIPQANNVDEWEWNFGDNSPIVYGAAPITHIYTEAGSYLVKVKLSNSCGSIDRYGNIFTSGSNIKEIEAIANSIDVYPSPASNVVTLLNKSDKFTIKEINIFNNIGQRIFAADIKDKKSNIDVSKFANGLYNIQVITDKGNVNKKFEVLK